jgi:hypothetical protein
MTVGELKQLVTTCKLPDETVILMDYGGGYKILSYNGCALMEAGKTSVRRDLLSSLKEGEVPAMVLTPLR